MSSSPISATPPACVARRARAPVDILVANAALPGSGEVLDYSPEEIDRAIDVNLRAPIQLARALVPGMVERGSGHLVFISSISGKVALGGSAIYSATKFGIRAFRVRPPRRPSRHRRERHDGLSGFIKDAGMWADTGLKLPPGVGTRSPEQVAAAVIKGTRATARRSTSRPSACAAAAGSGPSRRASWRAPRAARAATGSRATWPRRRSPSADV